MQNSNCGIVSAIASGRLSPGGCLNMKNSRSYLPKCQFRKQYRKARWTITNCCGRRDHREGHPHPDFSRDAGGLAPHPEQIKWDAWL